MATGNDDETKECTFQWKIENASQCWWLKNGESLESPTFIANVFTGTKWSLSLYPTGCEKENYISLYLNREKNCSGPDVIEVNFQLALLNKDGSLLKERTGLEYSFRKDQSWGFVDFERPERVFVIEREAFLPADILMVQCTLRKIDETLVKSKPLYGRTVLKVNRKSFVWRIEEFNTRKPGLKKKFKDNLIDFDLVLNEDIDALNIDMISFDDDIKYFSFDVSVIDSEGKKENCAAKNYSASDLKKGRLSPIPLFLKNLIENKTQYLPNDVLSLHVEFAFSSVENFGGGIISASLESDVKTNKCDVGELKYENMQIWIDDFKSLYNEGMFSDTEIRTSTRTFRVHKGILSARSPVLRRMFSNDMKEANSGHLVISDFEDDTLHRMLLYMYTDILEGLHFESASKLYAVADKYEILSLKSRCSSFLKDNMCPTRVCDVLILADLHQDDDLKNSVQAFILEHDEVFRSLEWEHFMDNNIKLAADIMYKKVNPGKIYKGNM